MFYARDNELKSISEFLESDRSKAMLLYGKRRVGKTTLLKDALSSFPGRYIIFECSEGSAEANLRNLCQLVDRTWDVPVAECTSFEKLFSTLQRLGSEGVIAIDEYQWLKQEKAAAAIDSEFKRIIDNLAGIKLILTGSYVSVMKELLDRENPVFGRFDLIINLKELDYLDSALFFDGLSIIEKMRLYSVFGGSPFVLSVVNPGLSLEENIERLILNPTGVLRVYIEYILFAEIRKLSNINRILESISNGKRRYSEIEDRVGLPSSGILGKYLSLLENMELVEKISPINRNDDRRKIFYSINDNLVRFYYAYVYPNISNISAIGEKAAYESLIRPSLDTFISYRFEDVARQYFSRLARAGSLHGVEAIGTFWYDDRALKRNGEFDCVVKTSAGYEVYEVKYYKTPMSQSEIAEEALKIRRIPELNISRIGFICSAGFEQKESDYVLLDIEDLYSLSV